MRGGGAGSGRGQCFDQVRCQYGDLVGESVVGQTRWTDTRGKPGARFTPQVSEFDGQRTRPVGTGTGAGPGGHARPTGSRPGTGFG